MPTVFRARLTVDVPEEISETSRSSAEHTEALPRSGSPRGRNCHIAHWAMNGITTARAWLVAACPYRYLSSQHIAGGTDELSGIQTRLTMLVSAQPRRDRACCAHDNGGSCIR